ncbi:hypothetical protein ERO13_D10G145301v2 [Gossypium hirsutum]|nr:hypothetical protein ERO13_D10G145301v2 [Gossypium hirsutum]
MNRFASVKCCVEMNRCPSPFEYLLNIVRIMEIPDICFLSYTSWFPLNQINQKPQQKNRRHSSVP